MTLFWFILLLSPLVFFHELAHFLTAKAFKVKVLKFSLGFGPALYKKKWGETEYRLSAIPLGGYVAMIGEDPNEELSEEDKKRTLSSLKLWKKLLVVLAGPIINFIIPILIFFAYNLSITEVSPPMMGTVLPNSPAHVAGLRSGDLVVSIDGDKVDSFDHFRRLVQDSPGESLKIVVKRPSEGEKEFSLKPAPTIGRNLVGMKAKMGRAGVLLNGTIATIGIRDTDSPAYKAGLRTGDRVISIIIGKKVHNIKFWPSLDSAIKLAGDSPFSIMVLRPGKILNEQIGLSKGQMKEFQLQSTKELSGVERGEFYISSTSKKGVSKRWGIKPGDRLWSISVMKSDQELESCKPAKKSFGSLANLEDVIFRHPSKRLCISWVTPSSGGSCFHSSAIKQDKLSSVDQLGNKITKYEIGFSTWRMLDVPDNIPVEGQFGFAVRESLVSTWKLTKGMVQGIYYMITGELERDNVGSVVMIAQMAQIAADRGIIFFLQIMALISLNLALLNLLPIPILDGGHALMFTIEAAIRKPISIAVRATVTWIGLGMIVMLMLFGFKNDLVRVFRDKKETPTRVQSKNDETNTKERLSPLPTQPLSCIKPS
jgi:regulator of sigma E protease